MTGWGGGAALPAASLDAQLLHYFEFLSIKKFVEICFFLFYEYLCIILHFALWFVKPEILNLWPVKETLVKPWSNFTGQARMCREVGPTFWEA